VDNAKDEVFAGAEEGVRLHELLYLIIGFRGFERAR
jgi:hypothetical protein